MGNKSGKFYKTSFEEVISKNFLNRMSDNVTITDKLQGNLLRNSQRDLRGKLQGKLQEKLRKNSHSEENVMKTPFQPCMNWNKLHTSFCNWGETPVVPFNLNLLCYSHIFPFLDWIVYHFETNTTNYLTALFFSSKQRFMIVLKLQSNLFKIFYWINKSTVLNELKFTFENGICGDVTDRYGLLTYISSQFFLNKEKFICDAIVVVENEKLFEKLFQIMPSLYVRAYNIPENDIQLCNGKLFTNKKQISPNVLLKPTCMLFSNSNAPDPRLYTGGVQHLWTYISGQSTKYLKNKNFAVCRSPLLFWDTMEK